MCGAKPCCIKSMAQSGRLSVSPARTTITSACSGRSMTSSQPEAATKASRRIPTIKTRRVLRITEVYGDGAESAGCDIPTSYLRVKGEAEQACQDGRILVRKDS